MPQIIYKNREGKRVPSVTTILRQIGWSQDALMWWAWNEGIEGRNYRETSGKAADVGTVVHAYIEADLKGEDFKLDNIQGLTPEQYDDCRTAIGAWHRWKEQTRLEPVSSEISLVSEELQFGGTMDCVMIQDRLSILDLKTSKSLYPNVLPQIAAYGKVYEECEKKTIEEYYVLRLGKEDAGFHFHSWMGTSKPITYAWEVFKLCRRLYDAEKILKKAV